MTLPVEDRKEILRIFKEELYLGVKMLAEAMIDEDRRKGDNAKTNGTEQADSGTRAILEPVTSGEVIEQCKQPSFRYGWDGRSVICGYMCPEWTRCRLPHRGVND